MPLTIEQFAEYFQAVHGVAPFPWQRRLVQRLLDGEDWPRTIALPTASGKTAVLDAATFALASEEPSDGPRRHPRRIFLVVDRRVVVDEAFERARRIECALAASSGGVLAEVARRLRLLSGAQGSERPIDAALMRGGIYRDDAWARSPVQPTLVVSTVDQVGSRLLFRGYGVSPEAQPIHAGLVGNDALIILDEAHCSRPFADTLAWIERYRGEAWAEQAPSTPFAVVSMSATPPPGDDRFVADESDRADPILGPRLKATKRARLVVRRKGEPFITDMAAQVQELAKNAETPRVFGVVVNRVDAARSLYEKCVKALGRTNDVILLTGRTRPTERDALLTEYGGRLRASATRPAATRGLIVVATQCIEVGADLDFDALVTECAALDALRQRFGRLDRLGRGASTQAAIVVREDQQEPGDDPVYGNALGNTWKWLRTHATDDVIDLGTDALGALLPTDPQELAALMTPSAPAPIMMPAHCDMWAQTEPAPHVTPDPAAYLHGVRPQRSDVGIVWRGDLEEEGAPDTWAETIGLLPPSSGETLAVPIHVARAWLDGTKAPMMADIEGVADELDEDDGNSGRRCLRWRGPDSDATGVVDAAKLRPGDTIVVPASYGGCDRFGWNPKSDKRVTDLGDKLAAKRRKAILRLHPGVVDSDLPPGAHALATRSQGAEEAVEKDDVRAALTELASAPRVAEAMRTVAAFLADDRRLRFVPHPSGKGLVVSSPRLLPDPSADPEFTDEDDTSCASTRAVPLQEHLDGVASQARAWVGSTGAAASLADSIVVAASMHDFGKADPRFQVWLHGGDRIATARDRGQLLAKSEGTPRTRRAFDLARRAAGYPKGGRHELVSLRLAETLVDGREGIDGDLVLHLIGSHHGHCRPFAPVVVDDRPVDVMMNFDGQPVAALSATGLETLDSGVAERFWRLVRRYGWWGLAWAEAVLRLADHRVSRQEQEAP